MPPFLALVPRGVWFGLAGAALLSLGYCKHQSASEHTKAEAYTAGKLAEQAKWQRAFDKMREASDQWRANYETEAANLADAKRELHNATLRRNAAVARNLLVHGPGRSAPSCGPGSDSELSASPGGSEQPDAGPDAPRPDVPSDDRRAIVPWAWLVSRAEEHDALLSEVDTWRSWYADQKALSVKARLELPKVEFGQ